MIRIAAQVLFVAVFVPISIYRRVRSSSRFDSRFHRRPSAWDRPIVKGAVS